MFRKISFKDEKSLDNTVDKIIDILQTEIYTPSHKNDLWWYLVKGIIKDANWYIPREKDQGVYQGLKYILDRLMLLLGLNG